MSVMQKELDIYLTQINNNHGNSTPAVTETFLCKLLIKFLQAVLMVRWLCV